MRLLFIVPYAPTPIRTRPYYFLKYLAARGHQITLVTLRSSLGEEQALQQWGNLGVKVVAAPLSRPRSLWNSLRALPTTTPLQAVFCWQPALARQITTLLTHNDFQACHIEHLRGALYGKHVQKVIRDYHKSLPVIWDSVDSISSLFEQAAAFSRSPAGRFITRLELGRTRKFEGAMVRNFDATLVTTASEKDALLELARRDTHTIADTQIQVVPNGVDTEYFTPKPTPRETATILFSGKMSYHANFTAALYLVQEIMPKVWQTQPRARVLIVGENPPQTLKALAHADAERIELTGAVPDMRPYMERATVACAPMVYGVGVQNKILEAMAMELPVIASERAARALQVQNGSEILIGADADALSQHLLCALQDNALRTTLAHNARRYVETHHRWQASVAALETLYQHPVKP